MDSVILQGEAISQLGPQEFDCSFLQKQSGGDLLYLDALILDMSVLTLTQGAGGAATSKDIHDTLQSVQVNASGNWGPETLVGSDLAALHFHARGLPFLYTQATGDDIVALSTGPFTRRFQIPIFAPGWFGRTGTEFTPMNAVLNDGIIKCNFQNPNVNTTAFTFTATMYALCHREAKIHSVAPLHYTKQTLKSNNASLPVRGPAMLVQHGLWKPASSRTAADVTTMNLNGGGVALNLANPNNLYNEMLWPNPEVTAMRIIRHFVDPIGGTNINYLPIFPNGIQRDSTLSENPTAQSFNQELQGGLTTSAYQNMTVWAEAQDDGEIERQWGSVGAIGKASQGLVHTANGNGNPNDRLNAYLPRVFAEPNAVAKV